MAKIMAANKLSIDIPVSSKVLQLLHVQQQQERFCDVKLNVGSTSVYLHSCVLATYSSCLDSLMHRQYETQSCSGTVRESWSALMAKWSFRTPLELLLPPGSVGTSKDMECGDCVRNLVSFMYEGKITVDKIHVLHMEHICKILQIKVLLHACKLYREASDCSETSEPKSSVYFNSEDNTDNKTQIKISSSFSLAHVNELSPTCENSERINEADYETPSETEHSTQVPCKDNTTCGQNMHINNELSSAYANKLLSYNETVNESSSDLTLSSESSVNIIDEQADSKLSGKNYVLDSISKDAGESQAEIFHNNDEITLGKESDVQIDCALNPSNEVQLGRYQCKSCDFITSSHHELVKHVLQSNHMVKKCPICEYQVDSWEKLNLHLLLHNETKPHICKICSTRHRTITALNMHMLMHVSEMPRSCSVCCQQSELSDDLHTQGEKQKKAKFQRCSQCDFSTTHHSTFSAHGNEEELSSFIQCSHAGCTFKTDSKHCMVKHTAIHDKEQLYVCEICDKVFPLATDLQRHALTHGAAVQTFPCCFCSFKTTNITNLESHLKRRHSEYKSQIVKVKNLSDNAKDAQLSRESVDTTDNVVCSKKQVDSVCNSPVDANPGRDDKNTSFLGPTLLAASMSVENHHTAVDGSVPKAKKKISLKPVTSKIVKEKEGKLNKVSNKNICKQKSQLIEISYLPNLASALPIRTFSRKRPLKTVETIQ